MPGEAADWDIQLAATPFDVSSPRAMYTIDLWDAVPAATKIDYEDGSPVPVPTGAHPDAITKIHALSAIAVCHVSTGAIRLDDPDATKFPGHKASPPNRPTPPDPGSVIGWSITDTDLNERFIDIHEASRAIVAPLIGKRIELAKSIGCDAIATQYNDQLIYQAATGHGFADLTSADYQSWSGELATRAHGLVLSIGLRTQTQLGVEGTENYYDWLMIERCAEFSECDAVKPYIDNARKAVFAIEYDIDENGDPADATNLCNRLTVAGITSGIIKKATLDSYRMPACSM
jgi:hypothetical protein